MNKVQKYFMTALLAATLSVSFAATASAMDDAEFCQRLDETMGYQDSDGPTNYYWVIFTAVINGCDWW